MSELLQAAFSSVNIIPTAFLVFVLLYWLSVIFGFLDLDFLNTDVEAEVEVDVDGISSVSWLNSALAFFNLGKVPLMVFLTFWALPLWVISILANHYLNNNYELLGLMYLIPSLIVSLFVAKVLTAPFVKIFAALEKEHDSSATIIGQVCTVILPADTMELGQATVKTSGSPLLLNVKTTQGRSLKKGETALVIEYNTENKYYLIEPYETI
ncbi:DUF1449 family protein [Pontibacter sp. BT310]|uniref:YqiJ family protein n=1 Tax=Pontibacter populi TaxID=890055 RepID=A0ABS6XBV4_9BACT|nr:MULTISPECIES: OB-fold-containig protein [Pontibacter]MBJ6118115.1 DUF1449 family protein [Pontibacter sp. BT310]MBR0570542.1 DUF1449 family protein [Microvirga sp. STS03]MBW3364968.1 YqiJ family protein [Pontibacter populi]